MTAYDSNFFDPPAPLARVNLRTLHNGNTVSDVPMLIDSGADLTLIPERFVDELKLDLNQNESDELTGFDGHMSVVKSAELDLVFLGRIFRGRLLFVNSQAGILGRNVLNHFAILLDGPQLSWQEQKNSAK
jgi:hypothetical protein